MHHQSCATLKLLKMLVSKVESFLQNLRTKLRLIDLDINFPYGSILDERNHIN